MKPVSPGMLFSSSGAAGVSWSPSPSSSLLRMTTPPHCPETYWTVTDGTTQTTHSLSDLPPAPVRPPEAQAEGGPHALRQALAQAQGSGNSHAASLLMVWHAWYA